MTMQRVALGRKRRIASTLTDARPGVILQSAEIERLIAAAQKGPMGLRNNALLLVLLGTGLGVNGLLSLRVNDYLNRDGTVRRNVLLKPVSDVGYGHLVWWTNQRVVQAIDDYLAAWPARLTKQGRQNEYRGLPPDEPLFINQDGNSLGTRVCTVKGKQYVTSNYLSDLLCSIFARAKVQGSPTRSAKLTLAWRLMILGSPDDAVAEVLGLRSNALLRRAWRAVPKRSAAQTIAEAF